jgi:truncated hemoglobin YjbI
VSVPYQQTQQEQAPALVRSRKAQQAQASSLAQNRTQQQARGAQDTAQREISEALKHLKARVDAQDTTEGKVTETLARLTARADARDTTEGKLTETLARLTARVVAQDTTEMLARLTARVGAQETSEGKVMEMLARLTARMDAQEISEEKVTETLVHLEAFVDSQGTHDTAQGEIVETLARLKARMDAQEATGGKLTEGVLHLKAALEACSQSSAYSVHDQTALKSGSNYTQLEWDDLQAFVNRHKLRKIEVALVEAEVTVDFLLSQSPESVAEMCGELTESVIQQKKMVRAVEIARQEVLVVFKPATGVPDMSFNTLSHNIEELARESLAILNEPLDFAASAEPLSPAHTKSTGGGTAAGVRESFFDDSASILSPISLSKES